MTGLALVTYDGVLAGGKNGPVVLPGDSANSILYTLQAEGTHMGVFAPEELAVIQAWIDGGAVNSAEASSSPVWEGQIADLFAAKCGSCHGAAAMGGLNVSTFADVLKGGATGEVIITGDSANSPLVIKQSGEHPGLFDAAELDLVKAWIDAGAYEK